MRDPFSCSQLAINRRLERPPNTPVCLTALSMLDASRLQFEHKFIRGGKQQHAYLIYSYLPSSECPIPFLLVFSLFATIREKCY